MKKIVRILTIALMLSAALPAGAQEVRHGSDDFKIGVAGYSYRKFNLDQTLQFLQDMGVKYFSVKDWWLPLDSTKEQMDAFKAKCAEYGIEGYILGPIYMKSKEQVDRTFAYAQRYGAKVFIGVPDYDLLPYVIEKVRETGIKVAIHTHGPDGAAFPDIRTVVEMVKDPSLGVGCCMDLGHTFRSGYDVAKDIRKYGKSIGLAFQIVDDILDIVSTTEELGKDAGSDIEKGKATYPSVVGLDRSREKAKELFEESIKSLDSLSCDTEILRAIAAFIITRVK